MSSTLGALRRDSARLLAALAIALASFGAVAPLAAATRGRSHRRVTHHRNTQHHSGSCIPQRGRGDRDADTVGGPSDGDGCV
jgi:hypothetical protein